MAAKLLLTGLVAVLVLAGLAPAALAAEAVPEIDLAVTKTDSADPVAPGQSFDYVVTVTNNGPSGALAVFLTDTFPAEVTPGALPAGCIALAPLVVECDLGPMRAAENRTLTFPVQVNPGVLGTFTNTAVVENREQGTPDFPAPEDADPSNNRAVEPTTVPPASIGDRVWEDSDGDGVQDAGEPGLPGVTVTLTRPDATTATMVTGADGIYGFGGLVAGTYVVTVDAATAPTGYALTTPGSVTEVLDAGEAFVDADFGLVPPGSIGDLVFEDLDENGLPGPGEAGIGGVELRLYATGSATLLATTTSAADGSYLFDGLAAGQYSVIAGDEPRGWLGTAAGEFTVTLAPGEDFLDADFGYRPPRIDLSVVKTVDPDLVFEGEQTTFVVTVANAVAMETATGVVVTDTLPAGVTLVSHDGGAAYDGATGVWTVGTLAPGASASVELVVTVDDAGAFTNVAEVTAADQEDVDSVPADGMGDDYDTATVNAIEIAASGLIGDTVFRDIDADGLEDSGDPGISGVTVTLTDENGAATTRTTDAAGKYLFAALPAGTYTVSVAADGAGDDMDPTTATAFVVVLGDGESYLDADFGFTEVLPKTGADVTAPLVLGGILLLAGAVLLAATRRRRSSR